MAYLKLMKLMYLAEKESLLTNGEYLTGDKLVSMPHGPVLSLVYSIFVNGSSFWNQWIFNSGDYSLSLRSREINNSDPLDTFDELSKAELKILNSVYEKFGKENRWDLVKKLHNPDFCPEWVDPQGSSHPIEISTILRKNGKSETETQSILSKLEENDDFSQQAVKFSS